MRLTDGPKPWTPQERLGFAMVNTATGLAVAGLAVALAWPQYDISAQRQVARAGLLAMRPIQTAVVEYATQHKLLPRSPQALVLHGVPVDGMRSPSGPVAESRFTEDGLVAARYRSDGGTPSGLRGKWLYLRPIKGSHGAAGIEFCIANVQREDTLRKRYWPVTQRARRCPAG